MGGWLNEGIDSGNVSAPVINHYIISGNFAIYGGGFMSIAQIKAKVHPLFNTIISGNNACKEEDLPVLLKIMEATFPLLPMWCYPVIGQTMRAVPCLIS